MARVTVEDCMQEAKDKFELVVLTAERAKRISSGAAITVDRDNDKDSVIALREIAKGTVSIESLRESLTARLQRMSKIDDIENDDEILDSSDDMSDEFEYILGGADLFENSEDLTDEDLNDGTYDSDVADDK